MVVAIHYSRSTFYVRCREAQRGRSLAQVCTAPSIDAALRPFLYQSARRWL